MNSALFFKLLIEANARAVGWRIQMFRSQSKLMIGFCTLFVFSYWMGGYLLFKAGFSYLSQFPGIGEILLDRMLYLFFAFLFVMLVISNMIIGYSTIYRSHETFWMLTLPVQHRDVFCWKLAETVLLSSWAFVFLSAPLILAYGSIREVGILFYFKVFLLYVPFIIFAGAIGTLLILFICRYMHRQVLKWIVLGAGASLILGGIVFLQPVDAAKLQDSQMVLVMNQLLSNSKLAMQPLLPSYWVATSIISWAEGISTKGFFFFGVLISNALMGTLICMHAGRCLFYDGWSRIHGQGKLILGVPALDREIQMPRPNLLDRILQFRQWISPESRALVLKDVRTFCRDASQWSQFVIFFGLIMLYVLNLRNVTYDRGNPFWAQFIAYLNMGALSMTLATLTTRFVFPQFSLEGKRLWIIGMVPGGLKRVLQEKFWLSSIFSVLITMSLTLLSAHMLELPFRMVSMFVIVIALMSFGLCGIAVGIGTLFPSFGSGSTANRQDDNPAKIVSGFGGTFCFVISLVYIVLVISAVALPLYSDHILANWTPMRRYMATLLTWIFVFGLSILASYIAMRIALRRVETMEI